MLILEVSTDLQPLKEKLELSFFGNRRHCCDCEAAKVLEIDAAFLSLMGFAGCFMFPLKPFISM